MVSARPELGSLRFSPREIRRLMAALLASLLVHLALWGGYAAGVKFGWWQKLHPPAWLQKMQAKISPPTKLAARAEEPTVFLDVSHADTDAPKQARYYSNKDSRAANPDPETTANQPRINGQQTDIAKTETTPDFSKLQPSAPQEPQTETKPAEAAASLKLGEEHSAKPAKDPAAPQQPAQPPKRLRTVKEALAQQQQLPGQSMRQDGGVRRRLDWSQLDAKATAFGDYDRKIVEAVTQRWYDLLDSRHFAQDRTGKVTVRFRLKYDGTVEAMQLADNTVGEMLGYVCQESIQQAAPFEKWPADLHRLIGANYRDITFTFYYY